MQNAEMEFVSFDAQDVIATSGILAYADAETLCVGKESFQESATLPFAVDVFGFADVGVLEGAIGRGANNFYAIIKTGRSGKEGYGVGIDAEQYYDPDFVEASELPWFSKSDELRIWLEECFNNCQ